MKYRIRIEREIIQANDRYQWETVYEQTVEDLNVKELVSSVLLLSGK